ncbi:MAG TPA: FAD-binding protein, partial [Thermodesulfovibrionales bacterium]|nr:FAD-binding protein [Thermodesulfovibrionales bacterium]
KIDKPPFYAVQFFPLSRKNMGGVSVDRSCRVVDMMGRPIKGLYAVGELTGLARVNGKHSTEGTFLGAAIITGRVAGRSAADEVRLRKLNLRR